VNGGFGLVFGPDHALYISEYIAANETVVISRIVPEPCTIVMLSLGALALRRKK
jgi:hypothetical protein